MKKKTYTTCSYTRFRFNNKEAIILFRFHTQRDGVMPILSIQTNNRLPFFIPYFNYNFTFSRLLGMKQPAKTAIVLGLCIETKMKWANTSHEIQCQFGKISEIIVTMEPSMELIYLPRENWMAYTMFSLSLYRIDLLIIRSKANEKPLKIHRSRCCYICGACIYWPKLWMNSCW